MLGDSRDADKFTRLDHNNVNTRLAHPGSNAFFMLLAQAGARLGDGVQRIQGKLSGLQGTQP